MAPRSGRGLALRALGRACFKYGLKEFGPVLGIADLAFRLLPLHMKAQGGGRHLLPKTFNKFSDQVVRLDEAEDRFVWENVRWPGLLGAGTVKRPAAF